jgi:hypothetical protein
VLHIGEKRCKKYSSTNKHHTQNEDVLCNPINPVNPDSKPGVRGKFILKPGGVEQPDRGTGHSVNREIYLYHGRANSIRPYYHP